MFIGGDDSLEIRAGRPPIIASIGFVVLLVLSVMWPDPIRLVNDQSVHASLSVDEHSFLGREAPAWDMIFWSIAGLYVLALLDSRLDVLSGSFHLMVGDLRLFARRSADRLSRIRLIWLALAVIAAVGAVWLTWRFLDAPLIAAAEAAQSGATRFVARIANRLGGGMNPVLIILFFWLAGLVFRVRRWWLYSIAMSVAAVGGGGLVQCVKFLVGRTRPEVWLGPFHYVDVANSSFPSGHTVGAFAIAGVLLFGSRSPGLRVVATLLAIAVGASRILAFRHWPSDVLTSAIIGLAFGWFFASALVGQSGDAKKTPESSGTSS